MTSKKQAFNPEEIRQLRIENRQLKQQLRRKVKHIRKLESVIRENWVIIDRLQSFIPERGQWRSLFLHMRN